MEGGAHTWHYGLIAKWWAEFNDDFRPHEIPYFQRHIEQSGEPALDVGCGTGRLLIPYLRAGLDVDGCDVSADMVALCREKAAREGLSPTLFVQAMHELRPPRRYRTIFACGAFGLGSTRSQDARTADHRGRPETDRGRDTSGPARAPAGPPPPGGPSRSAARARRGAGGASACLPATDLPARAHVRARRWINRV